MVLPNAEMPPFPVTFVIDEPPSDGRVVRALVGVDVLPVRRRWGIRELPRSSAEGAHEKLYIHYD